MKSKLILPEFPSVHFIGIGGIGMSALAKILFESGHLVTGSDAQANYITEDLSQLGIKINTSSQISLNKKIDLCVVTSAISHSNSELIEIQNLRIPIIKRSELLGKIIQRYKGISIVGSHGKTTTSGLIAHMLQDSHVASSFIVGGFLKNYNTHVKLNSGNYIVYEADESDGSFSHYAPEILVLTNLDNDHLDFYKNFKNLVVYFQNYLDKIDSKTLIIINNDDVGLNSLNLTRFTNIIRYGRTNPCQVKIISIKPHERLTKLEVKIFDKDYQFETKLKGIHNTENILASISVAHSLGIDIESISKSLKEFQGIKRRQDIVFENEQLQVLDDYAHHPTEITATIKGVRLNTTKNIIVYFQPHRFTRTRDCWAQYLDCFQSADQVFLLDIYASSEAPIDGVNTESLVNAIKLKNKNLKIEYCRDFYLQMKKSMSSSGVIISMGAGDISQKLREFIKHEV